MKLYVDDLRVCPEGWVLARTVTEAIRILATHEVKFVSLDHDISHAIMMDGPMRGIISRPYPCGETFEPVAWFIALACVDVEHVMIHTANPVGARKIKTILDDAKVKCTIEMSNPANGLE